MWLPTRFSDLDTLAQENWEWLKHAASLPQEGWTLKTLARRDDPTNASLSQMVHHKAAGKFTYRFQLRPQSAEEFSRHINLQQQAYHAFPHSEAFTSPEPVFSDVDRQVSLMRYIEGQPVSDAMKKCRSRSEELDLLRQCGAWLDAFHRSQGYDDRPFRPNHTLRRYQKVRDEIRLGERRVVAKALYLRGVETLFELAPKFKGMQTVGAKQHGDFHLRNLIKNGGQIAGIDVSKDHVAPVGFDIAKILLDYTSVIRSAEGLAPGEIVHQDTLDAFFDGYRLVGGDDPSVHFLLRARILATLNLVQPDRAARTDGKQRTLNRLRPIARNAFKSDFIQ